MYVSYRFVVVIMFQRSSAEYKDACELLELFTMTKSRLLDRDSTPAGDEGSEGKGKIILKVGKLVCSCMLVTLQGD